MMSTEKDLIGAVDELKEAMEDYKKQIEWYWSCRDRLDELDKINTQLGGPTQSSFY